MIRKETLRCLSLMMNSQLQASRVIFKERSWKIPLLPAGNPPASTFLCFSNPPPRWTLRRPPATPPNPYHSPPPARLWLTSPSPAPTPPVKPSVFQTPALQGQEKPSPPWQPPWRPHSRTQTSPWKRTPSPPPTHPRQRTKPSLQLKLLRRGNTTKARKLTTSFRMNFSSTRPSRAGILKAWELVGSDPRPS